MDAAKSAAPYCHHRLTSIDHSIDRTRNPDGGEVIIEVGFGKDPNENDQPRAIVVKKHELLEI